MTVSNQLRRRRLFVWGLMLFWASLLAVGLSPVTARAQRAAAAAVVSNCSESGISAAVAQGGPIVFACGATPITIVFQSQIVITEDTTLDGGGLITFSGGNTTRLFFVQSGRSLTLTNLVLEGGNSGDELGAAIFSDGGMLSLDHTTVQDSHGAGGAIYAAGGAVTLTNASLIQNNAGSGLLNDNLGGGLHVEHVTLLISHSILRNNTANFGGAVHASAGRTIIDHSQITSNSVTGDGGGLLGSGGLWDITDSQITGNTASGGYYPEGGGMAFYSAFDPSGLTLTNVLVSGNTAMWGGGLFLSGPATLNNVTISDNAATTPGGFGLGGGIGAKDVITLTNVTLSRNTASGGTFGVSIGGAIQLGGFGRITGLRSYLRSATFVNVTISGNTSDYGAGLAIGAEPYGEGPPTVISFTNTIWSGNYPGNNCHPDSSPISPTFVSGGYNLSSDSSCAWFLNGTGDLNNQPALLFPLADNGGPVPTVLPMRGSPVIDLAAGPVCPPTDARGISRPKGAACDSGAVEAQPGDRIWPLFLSLLQN